MKKLLLVLSVVAMASFLFVGCLPGGGGTVPVVNNAPEITSTAVTSATVGEAYTYDVDATDPDEGDVLAYSLNAAPTGMAIVPATGVISWTPAAAGTFSVIVSVSDGELTDTQSFSLTVSEAEVEPEPENTAPEITSTAITSVTLGDTYTYDVEATDADGDALTYSLITLTGFVPVGMTVNAITGVITWLPAALGMYPVTVQVSDGELTDTQSFTVTVIAEPVGPTIVSLLLLEATVGELYPGQVTATAGDDATLTCTLVGAPAGMTITAAGLITWTPTTAGDQVVTVVVTDGAGLSDTKDFTIVVAARVGPVITAIQDETIYYNEEWTYAVTVDEGTNPDYSFELTVAPYGMFIDPATGVITWTPIAVQEGLHPVIVKVTADNGTYVEEDEEAFVLLVLERVVDPLSATIVYNSDYSYQGEEFLYVRGVDCVPVEVIFNEAVPIPEDYDKVQIRWNDGTTNDYGGEDRGTSVWTSLDDSDDQVFFEGCLPLDGLDDCYLVCVEWRLFKTFEVCCPEDSTDPVSFGAIKVDSGDPCAKFAVTVTDCGLCVDGTEISWVTDCEDECNVPYNCCYDYCSGVGEWVFTLDYVDPDCDPDYYCDQIEGEGCATINSGFDCGCLLYEGEQESDGIHTIAVVIKDNVGNEFTDTWTLTFDTDELVSVEYSEGTITTFDGEWGFDLEYPCDGPGCDECFSPEEV